MGFPKLAERLAWDLEVRLAQDRLERPYRRLRIAI